MTGIGDAIGLTIGKEAASQDWLKVLLGATLGAAIVAPDRPGSQEVARQRRRQWANRRGSQLGHTIEDIVESLATRSGIAHAQAACASVAGIVGGVNAGWRPPPACCSQRPTSSQPSRPSAAFSLPSGQAYRSIGSGFGFMATVASALGHFLATPLGIVVGIAAADRPGVAAWMRFTASGKGGGSIPLRRLQANDRHHRRNAGGDRRRFDGRQPAARRPDRRHGPAAAISTGHRFHRRAARGHARRGHWRHRHADYLGRPERSVG
jgi:hypothetical protein